ncbi:phosphate acyltransferase PlsX [Staphylococcus epidermidis]|jgi:phosphate:acyl-[acyl carrier protein] acyltransferase|uniref:Phosphate acyltransferase n=3 Tax=Staphylococcus TaxID=1279 RepID=PLSX_STAES|nr:MULTISPECIES: phosphate acyltransferase PlsX [Staphylococcus]Q8CPI5.1 RecName: Full=Phosphate acyltransferase; AltName: Full=Acyl-ACP phosphotransacylase; AltName: Full=Acyl-[acyl-carrier-protein]--phosphate acyltransferase; AltName: Full=Phosphate-acyl-ACP acyltransferase [Staphylococcus epidermidis ATCC 12228]EHQ79158.1 fatty acid/phospholipid synthesis protein PlsX [Staphylococcus epidermidis VCU057]EHR91434.1 fatty acid/phospholipid synthesis protein PlsX [Staphylococcus epidermidis VCU12
MVKIAVDMMGGDDAPGIVLDAVKKAVEDFKDLEIILFGDESQYNLSHERIEFRHCTEKIEMEDEPVRAIKRKKDSSMVKMAEAVKSGEADGCVSAGNTGALMSAGLFIVGRIKGVARPALVVTLPTTDGKGFVFLDVGANADAKAEHLLQYAQLGNIYAQKIRGIQNPSVSLLNIGTEAAKGNSLTKKAYDLFEKNQSFNFTGNIEAKTLMDGNVDVVVTDGYTGNMVLKNLEGTAKSIGKMLKETIMSSFKNKLAGAVLKKDLETFAKKMDYSEYGGSVLLGLDGTVVKAHGSSNAKAFYSAIKQAKIAGEENIVQIMKDTVGE